MRGVELAALLLRGLDVLVLFFGQFAAPVLFQGIFQLSTDASGLLAVSGSVEPFGRGRHDLGVRNALSDIDS